MLDWLHRYDTESLLIQQGFEVRMQQDSQARYATAFGLVGTDDTSSEELRHMKGHISG